MRSLAIAVAALVGLVGAVSWLRWRRRVVELLTAIRDELRRRD